MLFATLPNTKGPHYIGLPTRNLLVTSLKFWVIPNRLYVEQYHLVTDITDVAGVTNITDVADITDITDVAEVTDITDITGGTGTY